MDKEKYLKEIFNERYGNKWDVIIKKTFNVLLNLISYDNISIIDDSITFHDDKIELFVSKRIDEYNTINGKIVIYHNNRYFYTEKNDKAKYMIGIGYNNGSCVISYKSEYDDFCIEDKIDFKLYKNERGITFIANDLYDCPLHLCYSELEKEFKSSKSVSRAMGLVIGNDIYNIIEFDIKRKQETSLRNRIFNRFLEAYSEEEIRDNSKLKNEMAIIYDLVSDNNISLDSINFQGREGFNKYQSRELANCIEVNVTREEDDNLVSGKFLVCGSKYVFYCDLTEASEENNFDNNYCNRIDVIPNTNDAGYIFQYKCKDDKKGYVYNIYMDYQLQASGRLLVNEYISLKSVEGMKEDTPENSKCIIPVTKENTYITDKSIYYLIGQLISSKYFKIMKESSQKYVKKLK